MYCCLIFGLVGPLLLRNVLPLINVLILPKVWYLRGSVNQDFTLVYIVYIWTQDNIPRWTEIKLLPWDVSQTSTPQPSKRTTSGVTAWNNEKERNIWKFIINISVNPMPVHPVPFNCEFVDIEWWCKQMWFGEVTVIAVMWHVQHLRESWNCWNVSKMVVGCDLEIDKWNVKCEMHDKKICGWWYGLGVRLFCSNNTGCHIRALHFWLW